MELLGMGGKRHPAQARTPAGGFFLYPAWRPSLLRLLARVLACTFSVHSQPHGEDVLHLCSCTKLNAAVMDITFGRDVALTDFVADLFPAPVSPLSVQLLPSLAVASTDISDYSV
jgi:hypothetical protein